MSVCELREAWLLARQRGIGGSDIAAIVGVSPFRRPIDIFIGKTSAVEFSQDFREFIAWGNLLEPVIRSEYARRSGFDVVHGEDIARIYPQRSAMWDQQTIIRSVDHEWMLGTPDGIILGHDAGLEIKNSAFRGDGWGSGGSDEIPDHYAIQCQWYMAVTGRMQWDVAVLFGGNKLETFRLYRNNDLIAELIHFGEQFWHDHVLAGVPPPVDESDSYARYLARKFSLGNSDALEADEEFTALAHELRGYQEMSATALAGEQLTKNKIAERLASAAKVKGEFGSINWVRPKQGSRTNWEAVATALNPPSDLIAAHTSPVNNQPYIRPFWAKEK